MVVDIRERVRESRGLLKQIELAIPGFRGYRKREDLRISDSLLRQQIAERFKEVLIDMEKCRKILSKKLDLSLLDEIGGVMNELDTAINHLKHAPQGYSGISADYQIGENELNNLYEWDISLLDKIAEIHNVVYKFYQQIIEGNRQEMSKMLTDIRNKIIAFNKLFDKRINVITRLEVDKK